MIVGVHRRFACEDYIQDIAIVSNGEHEGKHWLARFYNFQCARIVSSESLTYPRLRRVEGFKSRQFQSFRREAAWKRGLIREGQFLEFSQAISDNHRKIREFLVRLLFVAANGQKEVFVPLQELTLPRWKMTLVMQFPENWVRGDSGRSPEQQLQLIKHRVTSLRTI